MSMSDKLMRICMGRAERKLQDYRVCAEDGVKFYTVFHRSSRGAFCEGRDLLLAQFVGEFITELINSHKRLVAIRDRHIELLSWHENNCETGKQTIKEMESVSLPT